MFHLQSTLEMSCPGVGLLPVPGEPSQQHPWDRQWVLWRMLMGSWPLVGWYPWEPGAVVGTWMPGSLGIKCTGLSVRFPSFVLITCQVLGTLQGAPETRIWPRPAWCSYIHIHTTHARDVIRAIGSTQHTIVFLLLFFFYYCVFYIQ